ncbi:uncharacterized protein NECHADRAFT_93134 [Fusarium vanettenii 77-13-4]|uniref:Major facilitator superfamily (MFS) profile domain-containing protein n=1 Tax=Fusarium vanettenii (strain ATCC MYA-4622 / CBS 123669 / FGSC 9596 / NRRL 45880 / 77-13-4) TaxID=660122 RepID=C7Z896_FUSV7|nr:uncharacterized protein NECHADRAFT_93134 [Fusarium vanettenii 77-13-4]EEU39959.1 hypothetical protein NECHADRAFT_93134 [Fusarium vanettenii 77-13-4]
MTTQKHGLDLRATFNVRLTLTVLLIAFSQFNFGFEMSVFSGTQAMNYFEKQFGTWSPTAKKHIIDPQWLSLFNSLPYISFMIGLLAGSYVSNRWGRRMCVFTMSIWAIAAAAIVVTAKNRDHLLAGRVLNYVYIGMELAVVPIYQSEIVPARSRGFVVSTYQTSVISPRWLAGKARHEEGLAALRKLREGKMTEDGIVSEYGLLETASSRYQEKGTFKELFWKANIRQTFIVIGINFFLQTTGYTFHLVYGSVYIKSLGTINPFNINLIKSFVALVVAIATMWGCDIVGRRRLLMIGGSIQAVALMAMGIIGTVVPASNAKNSAIVAMMIVFVVGWTCGWSPNSHILSAEIPNQRLRDMSYRAGSVINVIMQFVTAFTLPYLLFPPYANLQSKVGFIYGSFAVLAVLFTYFCIPELQGRTLEEIEQLFAMNIPIRRFKDTKTLSGARVSEDIEADAKDDKSIA